MSFNVSAASRQILPPFSTIAHAPFDFWGQPVLYDQNGDLWCPGFTGATVSTNVFDKVFFGIIPTPGVAEVSCNKQLRIDKKKPLGSDGSRITVSGVDIADVSIRLLIWTPEQLKALNELWPLLMPNAGKNLSNPFDVSHPTFKTHDVKSLQIAGGSGPDPGPVARSRVFTIKAIEFLPPIPTPPKKNRVKTAVDAVSSTFESDSISHPLAGSNPKNTGPE